MESGGKPGKICISDETKTLLEKLDNVNLEFEPCGHIEVKALKEKVKAYFIKDEIDLM